MYSFSFRQKKLFFNYVFIVAKKYLICSLILKIRQLNKKLLVNNFKSLKKAIKRKKERKKELYLEDNNKGE